MICLHDHSTSITTVRCKCPLSQSHRWASKKKSEGTLPLHDESKTCFHVAKKKWEKTLRQTTVRGEKRERHPSFRHAWVWNSLMSSRIHISMCMTGWLPEPETSSFTKSEWSIVWVTVDKNSLVNRPHVHHNHVTFRSKWRLLHFQHYAGGAGHDWHGPVVFELKTVEAAAAAAARSPTAPLL